jgi:MFS family permease
VREAIDLLRAERRARLFFIALAQSAFGTGAAYVALLLIAFDRFESPLAITIVLIADLLPAMLLGPVFGAAADRWSRRSCLVVADAIRAFAFVGIGVVDSFAATVVLAAVAGAGTGIFTPAALAGLPSLVRKDRLAAATSLYGAIADLGYTVGPALAAAAFVAASPEAVTVVNGVTFALSAVLLATIPFGAVPAGASGVSKRSLFSEARDGIRATSGMVGVPVVLWISAAALFFGGILNVAELLFAEDLGAGESGFAVLVALYGLGFVVGSLVGAKGGSFARLKHRYLLGLLLMAAGFVAAGLAPVYEIAAVMFALAGLGNGMILVHERLLIQDSVAQSIMGRVFGVKDALTAWAFALAFLAAGGLLEVLDPGTTLVAAGIGGLIAWAAAVVLLRGVWTEHAMPALDLGDDADAGGRGAMGEDGADLVPRRDRRFSVLEDDGGEGVDDGRVELGPGVSR